MAKNLVHSGKTLVHLNETEAVILSGSVVVMGKTVGVALTDIQPGEEGAVQIEEVFNLPKKADDALGQGDAVYWNVTDSQMVKAATGNTLAGKAWSAAPVGTASVNVKLNA